MRILLAHTYYQQPGGEGLCFEAEATLLEQHGHAVHRFTTHNDALDEMSTWKQAQVTLWNQQVSRDIAHRVRSLDADVVHVHNTFPLLSPAVYYAARRAGAAVVQTLHNYRLQCVNGLFFRDGRPCEDCLGRVPWPGVWHACYHDSTLDSAGVAAMLTLHRLLGTWTHQVDRYVALTPFARDKFTQGGLPVDRLAVKPNFLAPDPGPGQERQGYALYVGRLSTEKGLDVLLQAWDRLGESLKIIGKGPLAPSVRAAAERNAQLDVLGFQPQVTVLSAMQQAEVLVFPSRWYEGQPRTIIEAFATGTPVIASDLGAMQSLVDHQKTGLLFQPGDPDDLAAKVRWLWNHPDERREMGQAARAEYEAKYTAERNYDMLMQIYEDALAHRRQSTP